MYAGTAEAAESFIRRRRSRGVAVCCARLQFKLSDFDTRAQRWRRVRPRVDKAIADWQYQGRRADGTTLLNFSVEATIRYRDVDRSARPRCVRYNCNRRIREFHSAGSCSVDNEKSRYQTRENLVIKVSRKRGLTRGGGSGRGDTPRGNTF